MVGMVHRVARLPHPTTEHSGPSRHDGGMLMTPPALQETLPPRPLPERELQFPGFNAHPLKGSVLPGSTSTWFVVMVAGTGPMDRNWSSPQLPKGTPGKDLALWLQTLGLGSLRYDKRFVGSRNPKLDVSLEAQAGDVKAALDLARTLPEAQGKKLLLVAQGEGALVALVEARNADAALFLGMPGQSMASLLQTQVRNQLPPESARDNLGFLEAAFQAIRWDRPMPTPGPAVHSGLVKMVRGLMAGETLPFVKGTLDLDPWAMAGRLPIPVACAWGDRDVQSPKPGLVPMGFKGTILELPGANHLLRKEGRTLAELTPAKALTAYGADTPMADLGPLATWIQSLQ